MARPIDIAIFGAGIAGLWTFARLKRAGYDVLLLEREAIGSGQTIASQGIVHSGLKYSLAGKLNETARSISAMPDRWRAALRGEGEVDLSAARTSADSQFLLIPGGVLGGLTRLVAQRALGGNSHTVPASDWPDGLRRSGFRGSAVFMDEPVLDVPSVLRALAEPDRGAVRGIAAGQAGRPAEFLRAHGIEPRAMLFTAAGSNHGIARDRGQDNGLETQHRPLLQGLMRPAPFPLFAHLVGTSDKPVATVTTHAAADGTLVWYLGAAVAERSKEADPRDVYAAAAKAFRDYLPGVDLDGVEWAVLPIDRVEGRTQGFHMPDTPTLHRAGNVLYGWPTKLTFTPMLGDMVAAELDRLGIAPSGRATDFSDLPPVDYAVAPWDNAEWTSPR
ncbi:MAG: FAD-dependent oxidoreductase [Thalassobaculum sp.]|uniref:FAD-dependent oxidoreductase n=1 Tax=Thalassobaculum sp. TaxID=2022740 RepID=UPI0032EB8C09